MVGSSLDERVPMVPRIRQVQIRNYKSIERAVVDLEPFTVFVGANGSGKSNFVDALAFVQSCLSQSVEQAFRQHGESSVFPRWLGFTGDLQFGFRLSIELSEDTRADYAFEIEANWEDQFRISRERCVLRSERHKEESFEVRNGVFVREIAGIRPRMTPDRLALFAASATEEFRPVYDFLSSIRVYSIQPHGMKLPQEIEPGASLKTDGSNAAAVLKALEERAPDSFERVNRLLPLVVEGIKRVGSSSHGSYISLEFHKDAGRKKAFFRGSDMSEGTLRVLGLLLSVYQLRPPSVLAVEEPEATVHPAAAELVLQVLLDAAHDRQVLITTHSPDILDAKELANEQIRGVTMEHGRTIIAPLSKASRMAIQERLYTPGELLRIDELHQDLETAQEAARGLDLFSEAPAPIHP